MSLTSKNKQSTNSYYAPTPRQTASLARRLAKNWHGGEIIALSGELGTGKTFFTQAVAKYLGVTTPVTSPTFVICEHYSCDHPTIKELIHIDAYRLNSSNDLINLGFSDFAGQPGYLTIIEWPEKIADLLPANTWHIHIDHQPPGRLITWQNPTAHK